jgi:hypothetical protein
MKKTRKSVMSQNQELQQELEAMKAYIHQVYCTIRYYYFWQARGSSECKFSACCGAYGLSLWSK